jgi:formate hydrogenlyase transcriptional activator
MEGLSFSAPCEGIVSYQRPIDSVPRFWLNRHGCHVDVVLFYIGRSCEARDSRRNKEEVMEGIAFRETTWTALGHPSLPEGKTGAMVFPLAGRFEHEPTAESEDQLADQDLSLEDGVEVDRDFREIIGKNAKLKAVLENVRIVAPADSSVLILGETGTGKELIARAIHDLSSRKNYPFVKINCAAIPSGLLESELFGHEKGAFTGAIAQKIGRFELANKGTLFLDEVGDIPPELQPKLLRVLQEQEFERLGSTRTQRVDVRVVAATNADLATLVAEKKFRSDLYYRLNVFPIALPPLRERRDDLECLVRHFASKYAQRMGKRITSVPKVTMQALIRHSWPGNVRELQNLMERAVLLTTGRSLRVPLTDVQAALPACDDSAPMDSNVLEQAERELILRALRESNWVVGGTRGAAARLRLNRTGLAYKIKKFGISRPAQ